MSTLEDLDDLEREGKENRKDDDKDKEKKSDQNADAEMKDPEKKEEEEEEDPLNSEILHSSTREVTSRRKLLENDMRIMKSEYNRLQHEKTAMTEKIKDNVDKIDNNR